MCRAFGWDAPQYAHLPLILNHDGSKLSKRQNDVRVESYQHRGIMPLALINFISKAGGGFKDLDLDTIYSQDELTKKVSFCRRISISFCIQFLLF
jgi:glutamyl-tRNA synthetase